jgi:hypothetical protein
VLNDQDFNFSSDGWVVDAIWKATQTSEEIRDLSTSNKVLGPWVDFSEFWKSAYVLFIDSYGEINLIFF